MEFLNKIASRLLASPTGYPGRGKWNTEGAGGFDTLLCLRLIFACAIFGLALALTRLAFAWRLAMLILAALVAGYDVLAAAIVSVTRGAYFDRCVLVSLACLVGFIIGRVADAAAMMIIFSVCDMFANYVIWRTRTEAVESVAASAGVVHRVTDGEDDAESFVDDLQIGDVFDIMPGEVVPCDCVVQSGGSLLDLRPIGGGAEPHPVAEGDELQSGSLNLSAVLRCEAIAAATDSTAENLRTFVEQAGEQGAALPQSLLRLVQYFSPAALLLGIVAMIVARFVADAPLALGLTRLLMLVAIASPSTLLAALPLVNQLALADAAKEGMLIRQGETLAQLSDVYSIAMEKTGALTDGVMGVVAVTSTRLSEDILLKIAAHAYAYSGSYIAQSLIAAYGGQIFIELISDFKEDSGSGVEVKVENIQIEAGLLGWMTKRGIQIPEADYSTEYAIYLAFGGIYAGRIIFSDAPREGAAEGMHALREEGVRSLVLFTNDSEETARKLSEELTIDEFYCAVQRERKLDIIRSLRRTAPAESSVMFIGGEKAANKMHTEADIDAAVCSTQAVGISAGADLLFLNGDLHNFAQAIRLAKLAKRKLGLVFGLAAVIKLVAIVLAFFGYSTLWFSVLLDGVAMLAASLFCSFTPSEKPAAPAEEEAPAAPAEEAEEATEETEDEAAEAPATPVTEETRVFEAINLDAEEKPVYDSLDETRQFRAIADEPPVSADELAETRVFAAVEPAEEKPPVAENLDETRVFAAVAEDEEQPEPEPEEEPEDVKIFEPKSEK